MITCSYIRRHHWELLEQTILPLQEDFAVWQARFDAWPNYNMLAKTSTTFTAIALLGTEVPVKGRFLLRGVSCSPASTEYFFDLRPVLESFHRAESIKMAFEG